jgi:hypothetical protein
VTSADGVSIRSGDCIGLGVLGVGSNLWMGGRKPRHDPAGEIEVSP